MKDVYEILRQKDLEVSRLQKEVEALRVVAPLLTDAETEDYDQATPASSAAQQLIADLDLCVIRPAEEKAEELRKTVST